MDAHQIPVYVERFGHTREEIFVAAEGLRNEFGADVYAKVPGGALGLYTYDERLAQGLRQLMGLYTYDERLAQGLRQLMAGCRRFSLEHLSRGDLGQDTGYVMGWFTLSLINAGLAQATRRSGSGWWVVSLFFGPIATLVLVLTYGTPEQAQQRAAHKDSPAGPAQCVSCGGTIPAGQASCPKCGWTYRDQAKSPGP